MFGEETTKHILKVSESLALAQKEIKGRILMEELDWSEQTKVLKSGPRKGQVVPAGIDSEFLKPFWPKIHKLAIKVLGPGPVYLMLDRAPAHRSQVTIGEIEAAGFIVVSQPPSSPDFNLLDAFLFPSLERECQKRGAMTHAEI